MRSSMSFKGCNFVAYPLLYVKIRNQDELGNFNSFFYKIAKFDLVLPILGPFYRFYYVLAAIKCPCHNSSIISIFMTLTHI